MKAMAESRKSFLHAPVAPAVPKWPIRNETRSFVERLPEAIKGEEEV